MNATLPPIASMAMNALPLCLPMFSPPKVLVCTRKHGKANGRMPAGARLHEIDILGIAQRLFA
jgi:hypothetical protein